jgi:hypothetical protein
MVPIRHHTERIYGAMPVDFSTPLCSGACGGGAMVAGFILHDLYPALAVLSMLCSSILGVVGLWQLWRECRARRKGGE